ncbi:uncharacterized protein LOC135128813 [Zophobas morio]|uniref:uncharacterized protein LOC135128813 n=1 Tax=Zophobas morio TaxID=2755281 RepID=UPI003082CAB5
MGGELGRTKGAGIARPGPSSSGPEFRIPRADSPIGFKWSRQRKKRIRRSSSKRSRLQAGYDGDMSLSFPRRGPLHRKCSPRGCWNPTEAPHAAPRRSTAVIFNA